MGWFHVKAMRLCATDLPCNSICIVEYPRIDTSMKIHVIMPPWKTMEIQLILRHQNKWPEKNIGTIVEVHWIAIQDESHSQILRQYVAQQYRTINVEILICIDHSQYFVEKKMYKKCKSICKHIAQLHACAKENKIWNDSIRHITI